MPIAIFPAGKYKCTVADTTVTADSFISVTFKDNTGAQFGAGVVRYIDKHPGVGFTVNLSTTAQRATAFDYEVENATGPGGIPSLQQVTGSGTTTSNTISYTSHPSFSTDTQIIDKKYVNDQDITTLSQSKTYSETASGNAYDQSATYTDDVSASLIYYINTKTATLSGGTGISYDNSTGTITNSAPDQVVSLTSGTGISISGAYPSFTITGTSSTSGVSGDVYWFRDGTDLTPINVGDNIALTDYANLYFDTARTVRAYYYQATQALAFRGAGAIDMLATDIFANSSGFVADGNTVQMYNANGGPAVTLLNDGNLRFTLYAGKMAYYNAHPTFSYDTQLTDKKYVDDLIAGISSGVTWQTSVLDKDLSEPPIGPVSGDRYIVTVSASGAWVGQENNITEYNGISWDFTIPEIGWACFVEDEESMYLWVGTDWIKMGSAISHMSLKDLEWSLAGHTIDTSLDMQDNIIYFDIAKLNYMGYMDAGGADALWTVAPINPGSADVTGWWVSTPDWGYNFGYCDGYIGFSGGAIGGNAGISIITSDPSMTLQVSSATPGKGDIDILNNSAGVGANINFQGGYSSGHGMTIDKYGKVTLRTPTGATGLPSLYIYGSLDMHTTSPIYLDDNMHHKIYSDSSQIYIETLYPNAYGIVLCNDHAGRAGWIQVTGGYTYIWAGYYNGYDTQFGGELYFRDNRMTGSGIPLTEGSAGQALVGFTAISLIGALNELKIWNRIGSTLTPVTTGDYIDVGAIKTDGSVFLATDIDRHTVTLADIASGDYYEIVWNKATMDKIVEITAVYYDLNATTVYSLMSSYTDALAVEYNGSIITVNCTGMVENDIITVKITYEK